MTFFSDDEFWDLRMRGGSVRMFVDSCVHLLRASATFKLAQDKNLGADFEGALAGIASILVAAVGPSPNYNFPFRWVDYSAEGFTMTVRLSGQVTDEFLSVFASDITRSGDEVKFRIVKTQLEAMIADWLARRRPAQTTSVPG